MTGCRVQQTCRPSRLGSSDPGSAEKTVEAGRNGKDGTSEDLAVLAEAWATVQAGVDAGDGRVGGGASMNPMRGVQLLGHGLRAVPGGSDRANRYVSEEGRSGVSIR
jgi:hypothetical protein